MEIKIQKNTALSQFCTYRTGGKALYFAPATDWQGVFHLREFAKKQKIPYMILGGGSNVLFPDEGYPGLVILNHIDRMEFHDGMVTVGSGAHLMKLLMTAMQHNLGGISALANVPGTVGGAIYGNAGIPGMWIGDVLAHASILPENENRPMIVTPDYFEFGYRTSKAKRTKDIILSGTIKLSPTPAIITRKEIDGYIKERAQKQPSGFCCGSFFKNPSEFPSAGWLIEQAGCKGMTMGGAQVSEKHANFFMNTGKATSTDILNLALRVHDAVKTKFDVNLEPEVQIIGNNPFKKNN
ncbi:UDP-N-acetylenolpyruvoylglucosamine reductase [Candidatus Peregrinibacteria bacterium CG_4_10_14_0_2_um_filter_43_11]|nr:MAG: UDP-N-acetylenolpyruvoylglucosamine reductase [Candidatus Peregrinibacteria bacterium CG_4_10_14_0_2_um_filter_43_11]